MALVCPKCGNKVSDKSESCLHCGLPITAQSKQNTQADKECIPTCSRQRTALSVKFISRAVVSLIMAFVFIVFHITENRNNESAVAYFDNIQVENIQSAENSNKFPWHELPCYQDFCGLTALYVNSDTFEENSVELIDLVLNTKVFVDSSSGHSSYIDPRITYRDCFIALEKNNCHLSFFTRESDEHNYVLLAVEPPENRSTYEHYLLTLVEFSIDPATNSLSLNSYANVCTNPTLGPRAFVSSTDPTIFGDKDLFLRHNSNETPYNCSFLADKVNELLSINAEEYSLFLNKKGFPSAFSYNGFMDFTGQKSPSIKINDIESDIFMVYHNERYADKLFADFFASVYETVDASYKYIGTTYNTFYVAESNAFTCDVYKLSLPKSKEEFYIIPFNLSGPVGVYYFSGNEIPPLWKYTTGKGENKFLELVWPNDKVCS